MSIPTHVDFAHVGSVSDFYIVNMLKSNFQNARSKLNADPEFLYAREEVHVAKIEFCQHFGLLRKSSIPMQFQVWQVKIPVVIAREPCHLHMFLKIK